MVTWGSWGGVCRPEALPEAQSRWSVGSTPGGQGWGPGAVHEDVVVTPTGLACHLDGMEHLAVRLRCGPGTLTLFDALTAV